MLSAAIASHGCSVAMATRCLHRFREAKDVTCLSKTGVCPHAAYSSRASAEREEGRRADLQVQVLSAYMPTAFPGSRRWK